MINIQTKVDFKPKEMRFLQQAARLALQQGGASPQVDLSIVLTDDEEISQLNLQFLGIDAATDVLSFPSGEQDPDTGIPYLGDIIISLPRAQSQAEAGGHTVEDELRLLTVHGVLHLLGFDHAETGDRDHMWRLQDAILEDLGCAVRTPMD
jgi:probable rRNA maturation factor